MTILRFLPLLLLAGCEGEPVSKYSDQPQKCSESNTVVDEASGYWFRMRACDNGYPPAVTTYTCGVDGVCKFNAPR